MTTRTQRRYQIQAIPQHILSAARTAAHDPRRDDAETLMAHGGEPLRCCLRNAMAGEALTLFSYEPPLPPGPYREVGPVFAHAIGCAGRSPDESYPADWLERPQVLRAYDSAGRIHQATTTHDGPNAEAVIESVLQNHDVTLVHSRNVAYGCYMFAIAPLPTPSPAR